MEQPRDLAALKSAIASQSIALSDHHHRIASVAFERPEVIAFGTASSVADIFAVSPSTVIRLTKALGFARFGTSEPSSESTCGFPPPEDEQSFDHRRGTSAMKRLRTLGIKLLKGHGLATPSFSRCVRAEISCIARYLLFGMVDMRPGVD